MAIGQYVLLSAQGIYEPIKIVEIEHEEEDVRRKMYSFQYKSRKILRASCHDHLFLNLGHPFLSAPTPFYALCHIILQTPKIVEEALGLRLNRIVESDSHSLQDCNVSMRWKVAIRKEFRRRNYCGLGQLVSSWLSKVQEALAKHTERSSLSADTTTMIMNASSTASPAMALPVMGFSLNAHSKISRNFFSNV